MAMVDRSHGALSSAAFRIAAASLAVLLLAVTAIAYVLLRQSEAALTVEVLATLKADAAAIEQVGVQGGSPAVRQSLEMRMSGDPRRLYLLLDRDGTKLAGNIDRLPPEISAKPSGGVFTYRRAGAAEGEERQAVALTVALGDGQRVLVGRDIEAEQRLLSRLRLLALGGMGVLALLGLAGGYVLSRAVLSRLDGVNRAARSIMAGDIKRRIPLAGSGDEIDRVADNLNRMLDRIEELMNGLREVSDNIAHDLKTPLNRLRNRAEAALRETDDGEACRAGLERTIEEADELIKTFNALLLIARLEAGALEGATEEVDLGRLAGGVADLYEPVADEAGLALSVTADEGILMQVNRHLVGQAVANLVDNAIKYGRVAATGVAASARGTAGAVRSATRVEVGVRKVTGGAEITVGDDGPGISIEDRERVWKRFVRLERSRSRPGTGLGLSLVAAVARLHGGAVRLEDNAPGLRVVLFVPDSPRT